MPATYRKLPALTPQDIKRFWSYVDKTPGLGPNGDCWKWTGYFFRRSGSSPTDERYGQIKIQRQPFIASRVAFLLQRGRDPGNLNVCHTCDYPPCVRDEHLFDGTHQDNMDDQAEKNRHARGAKAAPKNPPKGERNGNSKLTNAQRLEIARLHATGNFSQRTLASLFEIDRTCVRRYIDQYQARTD